MLEKYTDSETVLLDAINYMSSSIMRNVSNIEEIVEKLIQNV